MEQAYEQTLPKVAPMVQIYGADGSSRFCSDALRDLQKNLGLCCDGSCVDLFEPASRTILEEGLAEARSGTRVHLVNLKAQAVSGASTTLDAELDSFVGRSGERLVIASLTAPLQSKWSADKTERQNRLESIGRLAMGVVHDMNNALASVMIGVDILKMRYPDQEAVIRMIEAGIHGCQEMVAHVRALTAGTTSKSVSVHPRHLIRDVLDLSLPAVPKGIEVKVERHGDLRLVYGDPAQMKRIFSNLIQNAQEAITDHGIITIRASNFDVDETFATQAGGVRPGEYVLFQVEDTGCGIEPEQLARIFEAEYTTKGGDGIRGIGLSTALSVTKSHGGFLSVTSRQGHGSTFNVYLPGVPNERPGCTGIVTEPEPEVFGRGRLALVCDSDFPTLEAMALVMEECGFRVQRSGDVNELLEAARSQDADPALLIVESLPTSERTAQMVAKCRLYFPAMKLILTRSMNSTRYELDGPGMVLGKPFTRLSLMKAVASVNAASAWRVASTTTAMEAAHAVGGWSAK